MTTVEDLYYGNISPHERYIKRGTRVDKLVKLICKNEEELNSGLTEKPKEIKKLGSISFVPSVAGIYITSYIIKTLITQK